VGELLHEHILQHRIEDLMEDLYTLADQGRTGIDEVTFSLDASGILEVHARDALTGAEQRAALDLIGGIPQQDVAASRDRLQMLRR